MTQPLRFPYGSGKRYHLHHPHILCADIEATIDFYRRWFDAEVVWDGDYAGTRNVFLKIGIGAMHLYEKKVDTAPRNALHHLGIQVVGLEDLYRRMQEAGMALRNPIRSIDGGGYFMLEAPDNILLELFEPGPDRQSEVLAYYGYGQSS
ncbi:VOC family protein [Parapusillimonas granuli]|uniref:VOC family protein n=1 Tax=Parapusillimonas granuli TaxID=380911 RepID=A0A853FYS4_9BURK|nr:VOC family protein [Parapusillimonas granuli]MBB5216100.1 catechol 2,3-dioxygenase-like lactoylglutathione lyase family enzyme [Parapusillimonas granuli]MEB2400377.1 VOC family protein [Alcaligenaceae bacterium]NYT47781.1 VOC family protein [Parapusillimonas granuli]